MEIHFDRAMWNKVITTEERNTFIEKDELIQEWLAMVDKKTHIRYVRDFIKYLKMTSMTTTQLIELKEKAQTRREKLRAERITTEVLKVLYDEGIETFNMWITVASFYSNLGEPLAGKRIPSYLKQFHRKKRKKKITPQMVLDFSKGANVRDKTVIAMETCFPTRRESVTKMLWIDVEEYFSEKDPNGIFTKKCFHISIEDPTRLKKTQSGTIIEQHSFSDSWFKKQLDEWYAEYKRITNTDPQKNRKLPLFIQIKGRDKGKAITLSALDKAFRDRKEATKVNLSIHDFRSYVNTLLIKVLAKEDRDIILGHKLSSIEEAYTFEHLDEIKETLLIHGFAKIDPTFTEDESIIKAYRELMKKGMEKISLEQFKEAYAHSQALFHDSILKASRR